jgi:uncharacterized membrane protein YbhN (UPF0104 family)
MLRVLLLGLTFVFIGWALYQQWADVEQAVRTLQIRWRWILAASGIVLATYALLVQSWRLLLACCCRGPRPRRRAACSRRC